MLKKRWHNAICQNQVNKKLDRYATEKKFVAQKPSITSAVSNALLTTTETTCEHLIKKNKNTIAGVRFS